MVSSVIVVRPFNHIGPRQRPDFAAPGFARQIALIERGELQPLIKVGNLDAERDISDVRDTIRGYTLLMERGMAGTVYNVASGVGRSIRDILDALVGRARVPVTIASTPSGYDRTTLPSSWATRRVLRADTGWTPLIPFDRTIDDLLAYWRAATLAGGR